MPPAILYKYSNPLGVDILRNLRLKVTPPNEFNDPFELAPRMEPELSREQALDALNEPRVLEMTYRDAINLGSFNGSREQFTDFIKKHSELFLKGLIEGYPKSASEFRRNHINDISSEFGLICLSEVEDDILMWSHYTQSHTGFVIGFHMSHAFFVNPPLLQVTYNEERVLMGQYIRKEDPERARQVNSLIRRKSPHWKYEREWRQLYFLPECTTVQQDNPPHNRHFKSFDAGLIAKVIIGCRSTNEKEIRDILAAPQFSAVEVIKYEMHETDFSLVASQTIDQPPSTAP
jgi:hypothetical protein